MKTVGKVLRRMLAIFLSIVAVLLTVATAIAIPLSNNYANLISMAMSQNGYKTEGGSNPQYYESDYNSDEEIAAASAELALKVEQEGMVLMKNENDALPLAQGAKISLIGQNSVDLVYGGAGAGSIDTSQAIDLKTSMEEAGFDVNETLWDFYDTGAGSSYRKSTTSVTGQGSNSVNEVPQDVYTTDVLDSMDEYNDAAVVVIGRSGSESSDLTAEYLQLTAEETDMIQMATDHFDTVVVVLNTLNPVELSALDTFSVDACLWIGATGQEGTEAVGQALVGAVNPSGSLVDTWAYDATSAPSTTNLGDYTITNSEVTSGNKYMVYEEGIYVGYRYYETRYEDVVLGNESADNYDYASTVQFPFGYGLSYTDFTWSDYAVTENADTFTINVTVTNTGDVAGKDTVEIYMQSPYTDYDIANQVEKSSVELVGFAKTDMLEAGDSQTVTVNVDKQSMAVYDTNGYGTYIVEAGDYYFTAASDAHAATNNILSAKAFNTESGMTADGDAAMTNVYAQTELDTATYSVSDNGTEITNQLSDADITAYDSDFTYLSRNDWTGTWPTTYADGNWEAPEDLLAALEIQTMEEDESAVMPNYDTISEEYGELMLADMIGLDYDDPKWEALLDQISQKDLYHIISQAGYGTAAVGSIGLPGVVQKDGTAGISSTLTGGSTNCMGYSPEVVVASTWNAELVEAVGEMIGEDSISSKIAVWYAPAMNIHRSAISGRNFEYYSEDGFLSGVIGSAICTGFQSKGGIVTIKHFAINDEETNRMGGANFVNEQSARELYLLPFQMCVEDANANGLMLSMNRVGATWSGGHAGLMTNILKGEWGFEGFAITDQTSFSSFAYSDIEEGLAAGTDQWLCSSKRLWEKSDDEMTATFMTTVRNAAHRYLYVVANSNAMNGVDSDTVVSNVMPGWQKLIFPLIVVILLMDTGVFFAVRKLWGRKKKVKDKNTENEK